MVDSVELQQMARLVDMNRQRLEEIQNQLEKVEVVILEHDDAHKALTTLENGKSGHIPIGAGVMVETKEKSTTLVDFGSGVFGQATPLPHESTAQNGRFCSLLFVYDDFGRSVSWFRKCFSNGFRRCRCII